MFDTRKYTDLVTLWIKGFAAPHFEIQIRREQFLVTALRYTDVRFVFFKNHSIK